MCDQYNGFTLYNQNTHETKQNEKKQLKKNQRKIL